jgi:hypothetical protein
MRVSGIRLDTSRTVGTPFTGEIRIIPTEKNFYDEYFRGRRNVEVIPGGAIFTFR